MGRFLIWIGIALFVGALLSVAIAWVCAARSETRLHGPSSTEAPSEEHARSIVESMDLLDEPLQVFSADVGLGFGVTRIAVQVGSGGTPPTMAVVLRTESGWPVSSLQGDSAMVDFRGTPSRHYSGGFAIPEWLTQQKGQVPGVLPIRPLWTGLIVNTVAYGVLAWLLIRGPFAVRRLRRRARGQCPTCKYPIGESQVCTECGNPLAVRGPARWLHRIGVGLDGTRWGRLSRRHLPLPILALLLGTFINVVVAWSWAVWAPERGEGGPAGLPSSTPTEADIAWWFRHAPADASPDPPSSVQRTKLGAGKEQVRMSQSGRRAPAFTPGGVVIATRSGWPMFSMEYRRWKTPVTQVDETVQGMAMFPKILPGLRDATVPLRPIAPGFAANTIVYTAGLWAVAFGASAVRRRIRRHRDHDVTKG